MKIEDVARPGLLALGVMGVAATALLGFAAGVAVARDPEVLRRTARRLARSLERATLTVAQAREHVGDLWAEAREDALAEVDAAEFERAAAKASPAAPASAAAAAPRKAARKSAPTTRKPRAPRKSSAQVDTGQATDPT
ncbi:hypothetical protein [Hydrogenophaga sp.]|uniref:hypothetical protein n=1 Tax=Hydrogenophaga sp. TaxID=1904254 RepID=UPI0025B8B1A7|nr:hypothetical protein [Hydrogenophaga sp.]